MSRRMGEVAKVLRAAEESLEDEISHCRSNSMNF